MNCRRRTPRRARLPARAAAQGRPIAQKLLTFARGMTANGTDLGKALEAAGLLVVPKDHRTDWAGVEKVLAQVAAPPDADLRAALKELQSQDAGNPGLLEVEYLPATGIGGIYAVQGSALCQVWILFEKHGDATVLRQDAEDVGATTGCMKDGGSTQFIAVLAGQPVMLAATYGDTLVSNQTDFEWQSWLPNGHWGPLTRVRFRYAYSVAPSSANECQGTPARCAETASTALEMTRRYLRNPWALPATSKLAAAEQREFADMLASAPDRKAFAAIAPAWFAAHLNGRLVVVGIDATHLGSHIYYGAFDVGFWGQDRGDGKWWFVDQNMVANAGRLLGAALIPPGESH